MTLQILTEVSVSFVADKRVGGGKKIIAFMIHNAAMLELQLDTAWSLGNKDIQK